MDDFRRARDFLLEHRLDYETAYREFRWPDLSRFNFALDWFDQVQSDRPALWIVEDDGSEAKWSYRQLAERSNQVAGWFSDLGLRRGDSLILMLGNQIELWETILAAIKLGVILIPTTTLLHRSDIIDRVQRGNASWVIAETGQADKFGGLEVGKIGVGESISGWQSYAESKEAPADFSPPGITGASDPLLLYFTSGTTALPKLVEHTHVSYPVGHLSTMYWIGLQPGDIHLNISSPGWAKHAWSNVFAPWIAEATALVLNYSRFSAENILDNLVRCQVDSFCAPPTVWRMLIQGDLKRWPIKVRELVGAGEPLNPEVIEQVERAWGITIRDGFGQTETTAQIGNPPGQPLKPGSMGRALPGYGVALIDPVSGKQGDEGEICLDLTERPLGLMVGYRDDPARTAEVTRGGFYHTGDVASRDADGYITYVGRSDDVFKASDYRISPFELESVLLEHPAVAEAAVVPAPDPIRLAVPKAYVVLTAGHEPSRETARSILAFGREHLAAFKRVRRLEFADLPKTISGKIRRVELRSAEFIADRLRNEREFWEEDFDWTVSPAKEGG
ncbi:MAG TPA: AMP-binding protein [Acidimicrobiia bacterium]|nr:AMP-binding protein [Acidimicrobiia bacterium]